MGHEAWPCSWARGRVHRARPARVDYDDLYQSVSQSVNLGQARVRSDSAPSADSSLRPRRGGEPLEAPVRRSPVDATRQPRGRETGPVSGRERPITAATIGKPRGGCQSVAPRISGCFSSSFPRKRESRVAARPRPQRRITKGGPLPRSPRPRERRRGGRQATSPASAGEGAPIPRSPPSRERRRGSYRHSRESGNPGWPPGHIPSVGG